MISVKTRCFLLSNLTLSLIIILGSFEYTSNFEKSIELFKVLILFLSSTKIIVHFFHHGFLLQPWDLYTLI